MAERERVVLVTGVSSGIGRAIVLECLRRGHRVSGTARRRDRLDALRAEAGRGDDRLHLVAADVNGAEETRAWLDGAVRAFGRVDALVHNAGYGVGGPIESLTEADFRDQFETNFFAVVRLTLEALPRFEPARGGDLVLVSSVLGLMALPQRSPYCASKFALEGFAESVRPELARRGIRVTVINPGATESEFWQAMRVRGVEASRAERWRRMSAEEVARVTVAALGRGPRRRVLTAVGRLGVAVHCLAPWLYDRAVALLYRRELDRRPAGGQSTR
jgi:NAD(P)-dependent dehydrogenase (short-subunit alcohol dehydrogenase family)